MAAKEEIGASKPLMPDAPTQSALLALKVSKLFHFMSLSHGLSLLVVQAQAPRTLDKKSSNQSDLRASFLKDQIAFGS